MGSDPLHLGFTCTGSGVSFTLVTPTEAPVAGWGSTVEEAMANAYAVPEPQPKPAPAERFRVVAGTDAVRSR